MSDSEQWNRFVVSFEVWSEALPYLHLMFDQDEVSLVLALQGRKLTVDELAARLELSPVAAQELVRRCYVRSIVNRTEDGGVAQFESAGFYAFLGPFAKFGRWDELPLVARQALDRRYLDEFAARQRFGVAQKAQGLAAETTLPNDTVMLLGEVEAMLEAATDIIVQPCDCRRLGQYCDRPVEVCIWLDEAARHALDRGHGRRLSREEAKALVRWADKKGLMHTSDSEWHTRGLHAICNCCACDCYPFRAAQALGSKGVWPRSRYLAVYDPALCSQCGVCVRRCHFEAFYHDGTTVQVEGKLKPQVHYDPGRCWGCGLCANTCPTGAIKMCPLDEPAG